MAYKSYTEMAEMYEAAIVSIVGGKLSSYSIAGRSFTKHDLSTLERLYQYYRQKAKEETFGGVSLSDIRGIDRGDSIDS